MSLLMIMSVYGAGKNTHSQAHIVSLDPCRIRSCLEQSWLQLGTQPDLPQHERKSTRGRKNRPNGNSREGPLPLTTHVSSFCQLKMCFCCTVITAIIVNYFNNSATLCGSKSTCTSSPSLMTLFFSFLFSPWMQGLFLIDSFQQSCRSDRCLM